MRPDDLSPFYNRTGPSNVKINGLEMAQNLVAPAAWALAIIQHKPAIVIEIGTSKGGLSSILSSCTAHIGSEFHTFDVHGDGDYNQYPLYGNAKFHLVDCFLDEGIQQIRKLMEIPGKVFLLCDGGNKPLEWNFFKVFLKSGDVIAAHDYADESIPNYSPLYWGCIETHAKDLNVEGLKDFEPKWFQCSAWCVKEKI